MRRSVWTERAGPTCLRAAPDQAKRTARRAAAPVAGAPGPGRARRAGARRRKFARQPLLLAGEPGARRAPRRCARGPPAASRSAGEIARGRHSWRHRDGQTDCSPGTPSTPAEPKAAPPSRPAPAINIRPDCGVSKPAIRLSSVDLPAPLGPMHRRYGAGLEGDVERHRHVGIAEATLLSRRTAAPRSWRCCSSVLLLSEPVGGRHQCRGKAAAEHERQPRRIRRSGSCPCARAADRAASAPHRCRTAR